MFFKRYSDQIIVLLVGVILVLLLILYTDIHIAKIEKQMKETVHQ